MKHNTCCFTGHRPQSLPWGYRECDPRCRVLKERLRRLMAGLITEHNVGHFISGMAQGVDTYAAEAVLELKQTYPAITLECALPFEKQMSRWSYYARYRHGFLLEQADRVTLLQSRYSRGCFQKRNRYMVDHSAFVLAVWDGRPSGTGSTVDYARQTGRVVLHLEPAGETG